MTENSIIRCKLTYYKTSLTREPYRIKNFWLLNPRSEELQVAPLFPGLETLRLDFVFQVGNVEDNYDDNDD